MANPESPAQFRRLLTRSGIVPTMAVHDVFTGLIAEQSGIEAVFMGGFGASASLLGLPDLNFLAMSEMADAIRRMTSRLRIPVIADGDTGHGDLHNVVHTVESFENAGAAGILLEDQVMPKRCGHFAEKQVIPIDDFVRKIKTAVAARRNPDFTIFARTDARQMHGLDDAIDRVNRCYEVGADVAFVEAPQSEAELAEIPRRVRAPLFANMLTGGVTPILSVAELGRLGYQLAVAPIESLLVTAKAMRDLCAAWKDTGRVDHLANEAMSFDEIKDLLGVDRYLDLDKQS